MYLYSALWREFLADNDNNWRQETQFLDGLGELLDPLQCSVLVQCRVLQCNLVQCSLGQCSVVMCSVFQCSEMYCNALFLPRVVQELLSPMEGDKYMKLETHNMDSINHCTVGIPNRELCPQEKFVPKVLESFRKHSRILVKYRKTL